MKEHLIRCFIIALFYGAAVKLGLFFFINQVSILWPANGIALAFFIRSPIRRWPTLICGVTLGYYFGLYGLEAQSLLVKTGFLLANFIEVIPAAFIIRHYLQSRTRLDSLQGMLIAISFGVFLGPLFGSLTATLVAMYGFGTEFSFSVWATWGVGNAVSTLLMLLPSYYFLASSAPIQAIKKIAKPHFNQWEAVSLLAISYIIISAVFHYSGIVGLTNGALFLVIPLAIWAALSFNNKLVSIWLLLGFAYMAIETVNGNGPFIFTNDTFRDAAFHMHTFTLSILLMVYLINSSVADRKRSLIKLEHANSQLKKLATVDPLTKIANRRHFDDMLSSYFLNAHRNKTTLTLIILDIDYFKQFNDTYGHVHGDKCLTAVANAISNSIARPQDFCARIGGEEFACILPSIDKVGAEFMAKKIKNAVSSLAIEHRGSSVDSVVTVSLGVATMEEATKLSTQDLYRFADTELYAAKDSGRNTYCITSVA